MTPVMQDGYDVPLMGGEKRHQQMKVVDERFPACARGRRLIEGFGCFYGRPIGFIMDVSLVHGWVDRLRLHGGPQ